MHGGTKGDMVLAKPGVLHLDQNAAGRDTGPGLSI